MKKKKSLHWIVPLLVGLCLGAVCAAVGLRFLRSRTLPVQTREALNVNGQSVSMRELEDRLKIVSGTQVLQRLIEEKLVEQECLKLKITLTPEEEEQLKKAAEQPGAADLRVEALRLARVALLQRHLLLQNVDEREKQEVFAMYQPQLVQYEISVILLPTRNDGKFVLTALADKVPFEKLASDLSMDPSKSQGGRLGLLNLPQIRRYLGNDVANQVQQMKPNTTSKVVTSPHGLLVIKLGQVRSTYEQLKPVVENLIADSKRVNLAYRLGQSAKITSPFLTTTPLPAADIKPQGIVPEEVEK